jgi:hypothetical protein
MWALTVAMLLAPWGGTPAWAQGTGDWSFLITPQVWLSHVAKNGFAAAPNNAFPGGFLVPTTGGGDFVTNAFQTDSSPKDAINPQWGLQVAAQSGRWTFALAFQYVDFKTENDITYVHPEGVAFCLAPATFCVNSGDRWAKETVDTTRIDLDASVSYFFPDVIPNWVDASIGGGIKFIFASAKRRHSDYSVPANVIDNLLSPPGIYVICVADDCTGPADPTFAQQVRETSHVFGVTIPMGATVRLSSDNRWLLPVSVTPMFGAEVRNDKNVVYGQTVTPAGQLTVHRLDGTTFIYGVTADATVRYVINDMFSAYAGMRVQYFNGHDEYLAYGPVVGMTVRFGGPR